MPFDRPTLETIVTRITGDFQTKFGMGVVPFLRRTVTAVLIKVYGAAVYLLYGHQDYQSKQLFVSTATGAYLDRHEDEYLISRMAATKAIGGGAATGTPGTPIPAGTELKSTMNTRYLTDSLVTIGGGGSIGVFFTAKVAGADSNDPGGINLTFISPIAGVDSALAIDPVSTIAGGSDEETDAALRTRILARKQMPPQGGAESDYLAWVLAAASGITRAWIFPQYWGAGTVAVAFVRDADSPIVPTQTQRDTVYDALLALIPVTAAPGFSVIDLSVVAQDFDIDIYPNNATIQAAIQTELEDLILTDAGPGQTLYISRINGAIAKGMTPFGGYFGLSTPAADDVTSQTSVKIMGTITFGDY